MIYPLCIALLCSVLPILSMHREEFEKFTKRLHIAACYADCNGGADFRALLDTIKSHGLDPAPFLNAPIIFLNDTANANAYDTPFLTACGKSSLNDLLENMILDGADLFPDMPKIEEKVYGHIRDGSVIYERETGIHQAVHRLATDNLATLLRITKQRGLDLVNIQNDRGSTALHCVFQSVDGDQLKEPLEQEKIIHLLCNHGADPNIQDNSRCTPLAILLYLREHGPLRVARPNQKRLAQFYQDCDRIIAALIAHGARMNEDPIAKL